MSKYKASSPEWFDPIAASTESTDQLYSAIREDIVSGRLKPNQRIVVTELAILHGSSTTPVREVLQILRGEGFVIFTCNRGARVRPIDRDFIRDIHEIRVLIEPALTHWFVGMATEDDIATLERIQDQIEANNFTDPIMHSDLDTKFHTQIYVRHYNRHVAELWWKHREVLRAVHLQFNFTLARRAQVIRDHRELIAHIKAGDAEKAAALMAKHVECSGLYLLEHMRAMVAAKAS